jgi:GTP-binding protein EngB required for normal cell division
MVRRNGAEARKERLQEIARFIQRALYTSKELSLSNTLVQVEYNFGLTGAKAMEYLRLLEKLGQFILVEKEDKIKKSAEGSAKNE